MLITLNMFLRGRNRGTPSEIIMAVVLIHYFSACLDNLVMTGLGIWGAIALNSDAADEFADADPETGLPAFITVTTVNVVMALLYACSHILALPITICMAAIFRDRINEYMAR